MSRFERRALLYDRLGWTPARDRVLLSTSLERLIDWHGTGSEALQCASRGEIVRRFKLPLVRTLLSNGASLDVAASTAATVLERALRGLASDNARLFSRILWDQLVGYDPAERRYDHWPQFFLIQFIHHVASKHHRILEATIDDDSGNATLSALGLSSDAFVSAARAARKALGRFMKRLPEDELSRRTHGAWSRKSIGSDLLRK